MPLAELAVEFLSVFNVQKPSSVLNRLKCGA